MLAKEWRQPWRLRTATSLQPTRRWGAQSYDQLQLSSINRMSGLGRQSIPGTPTKTHTWCHLQVSLEKPEWRKSQVKQTPDLQNRASTVYRPAWRKWLSLLRIMECNEQMWLVWDKKIIKLHQSSSILKHRWEQSNRFWKKFIERDLPYPDIEKF